MLTLMMSVLFIGACQSDEVEIDKKVSGNINKGTTNCTWGVSKAGNCTWSN